jgi:hypothetical protein
MEISLILQIASRQPCHRECEQLFAEHRELPSSNSNEEPRRTNQITYLDYLDTVEVIGSIPVAPIS